MRTLIGLVAIAIAALLSLGPVQADPKEQTPPTHEIQGKVLDTAAQILYLQTSAGKKLKFTWDPKKLTIHGDPWRKGTQITVWYYTDAQGVRWAKRIHGP